MNRTRQTQGMVGTISAKTVTYDFERPKKADGDASVNKVECSEFVDAVIARVI